MLDLWLRFEVVQSTLRVSRESLCSRTSRTPPPPLADCTPPPSSATALDAWSQETPHSRRRRRGDVIHRRAMIHPQPQMPKTKHQATPRSSGLSSPSTSSNGPRALLTRTRTGTWILATTPLRCLLRTLEYCCCFRVCRGLGFLEASVACGAGSPWVTLHTRPSLPHPEPSFRVEERERREF